MASAFNENERRAEREVIACVAASHAGFLNASMLLSPADFASPAHRKVFIAAAMVGDDIASWSRRTDAEAFWHEASRRFWGLPETEHARVVAIADLAAVDAGQLLLMVRARVTFTDEHAMFSGTVLAAAERRREVVALEERLRELEDEAS